MESRGYRGYLSKPESEIGYTFGIIERKVMAFKRAIRDRVDNSQ